MTSPVLELRSVDKSFGPIDVLHDISLKMNEGEVLCLLGPNGSGKTTLFKTLLGLLPIQDGTVILDDRDLQRLERDEIARRAARQAGACPLAGTPARWQPAGS